MFAKWERECLPVFLCSFFTPSSSIQDEGYGCNTLVHIFSFELLHHELAAGFVTQEKGSVSRECAHHCGSKARVKRPCTYAHTQTHQKKKREEECMGFE